MPLGPFTRGWLLSCSETLLEEMGAAPKWVLEMNSKTRATPGQARRATFAEAWDKGKSLSDSEAVELALESLAEA